MGAGNEEEKFPALLTLIAPLQRRDDYRRIAQFGIGSVLNFDFLCHDQENSNGPTTRSSGDSSRCNHPPRMSIPCRSFF